MKLKYDQKGIKICNGDFMEAMALMQNKAFELAIVHPPYGINVARATEIGYKGNNVFIPKAWDKQPPLPEYFTELRRVSSVQIIWGGNYFDLLPTRCFLIWDKGEGFYGRTYAECEHAWTSFDANARIFKRDPLCNGDYKDKIHPTQKPVKLYEWLLTNYAKPGDRILDTHLGSGSSAIACDNLGFELTTYELDEEYVDGAVKRLVEHRKQLKIFDNDIWQQNTNT